jgi:hypothetical protein
VTKILENQETVYALNSVLTESHRAAKFCLIYPVISTLSNTEFINHLDTVLINKIHDASIYIPDIFINYNKDMYEFYCSNQKIFDKISTLTLYNDAPLIRSIYLSEWLLMEDLNTKLLDQMIIRLHSNYPEFQKLVSPQISANVQLLDTLYGIGSGANGVPPFELVLRTIMVDAYFPLKEGETVMRFIDGSTINGEHVFIKDNILAMYDIVADSDFAAINQENLIQLRLISIEEAVE